MNKKQQRPSDQRIDPRQRILQAAIQGFSEKGLQGARTREIAQAAGVNLAMLHYYHSSKEELYIRAVTPLLLDIFGRLKVAAASSPDPRERLGTVVGVYFDFLKDNSCIPRLIMWELVTGAQVLKRIFGELLKDEKSDLVSSFRSIFQDGQDQSLFRPHDPDRAILSMVSLCVFPFIARDMISAMNPDLLGRPEFLKERREHVLNLLLQGISAPPQQAASSQNDGSPSSKSEQITLNL